MDPVRFQALVVLEFQICILVKDRPFGRARQPQRLNEVMQKLSHLDVGGRFDRVCPSVRSVNVYPDVRHGAASFALHLASTARPAPAARIASLEP